jgi:hydrogenase maturation protease
VADTLILGLGNPILSDDAVGLEVARRLKERLNSSVDVVEASVGGMGVLDLIAGYRRLIVVDSIKTEGGAPGTLHKMGLDDLMTTIHTCSPHDVNFATALELGKRCGVAMPEYIAIYAIEVADNTTFSEDLTPSIKEALPRILDTIVEQESILVYRET